MAVAYTPGQLIGREDLNIFLTNAEGNVANAAEITYAIYWVDPGPPVLEVLIGSAVRVPANPAVGEYYAALMVPSGAAVGDYRIRWTIKELVNSPATQVVQEFNVIVSGTVVVNPTYSAAEQEMIDCLRMLLRDHNPDKFYHFRPPEHEGSIGAYNRVFGQIWEDQELKQYLERAIAWWDMFPPSTNVCTINNLVNITPKWCTAIYWYAMVHALFAVSLNWVADEFDYSIGGVSLSIEKSSKYESLKQNAESQFEKAIEAKRDTVKIIRGLQQPRFGVGIRSAFGPHVGKGVLSPRSFLVFPIFLALQGFLGSVLSQAGGVLV